MHREPDGSAAGCTEEPTSQHQEPERQGELHQNPEPEMDSVI